MRPKRKLTEKTVSKTITSVENFSITKIVELILLFLFIQHSKTILEIKIYQSL